jgi:bacteriocin-like protein
MSKDTKKVEKKVEKTKPKAESSELSEKDLNQVAGGRPSSARKR